MLDLTVKEYAPLSDAETVEAPKIEPVKHTGRKAAAAQTEENSDDSQIAFNRAEHDELEFLATTALDEIKKEIAGKSPSELPEDVATLQSNLTAALRSLKSTSRDVRVPAVIRNVIRDNARFVSSGQLEHEIESGSHDDHKVKSMVHEIEEAHAKAAAKTKRPLAIFRFHSAKDDELLALKRLHRYMTPEQKHEQFIFVGGLRTIRRVQGHDLDRSAVATLGGFIGENNADWAVNSTEIAASSLSTGMSAVLTGDTKKIDAGSLRWGLRAKHILKDHMGLSDETAQDLGHMVTVGTKAVTYTGTAVIWTATHPLDAAEKGASAVYELGQVAVTGVKSFIWGEPPKGAQPQGRLQQPAPNNMEQLQQELRKLRDAVKVAKGYDTNGDGIISVGEVAAVLNSHGVKREQIDTKDELQAVLNRYVPPPPGQKQSVSVLPRQQKPH